ncbi:MAG: alanine:cation symporter family protein, partial [Clostridium sp.]|nr:alanine:cation symporter family protein [Clostridium sp.]
MIELLAGKLWFPWILGLSLLVGLLYSVASGFFPIFDCRVWIKTTLGSLFRQEKTGSGLSSLQALSTALAATIGTGSIAGVAAALPLGGPGSIFWMWVTALLGMMTSCAEKILAVRWQHTSPKGELQGGPMFYLRDGLHSPLLAAWFCLCCIPAAFVGGNLIQASSIADITQSLFGWDRLMTGLVFAALSAIVLLGGIRRIAGFSTVLVPVMALLYLGGGICVLIIHRHALPEVVRAIFTCAFRPDAAFGGAAGWSVAAALRHGVARGVFASEAGLGTSAIAHGAAQVSHPAQQGMWGILEVFCSTLLVCTVTALVILVSTPDLTRPGGAHTTAAAFGSALGHTGELIVALSLLLFAFSSILGWSYYGQQALRFLSGSDKLLFLYKGAFLLCIPL